ncbi:MAG TPA: universal stress protein [Micromonosporaceae bacterium]
MVESFETPVVVGVDGSALSLTAVRLAAKEAVLRQRPLRIVHAFLWPRYHVPDYGALRGEAERIVNEAMAVAAAGAPRSPVSGHVVDGEPGTVLRRECDSASVLVLGPSNPSRRFLPVDSVVMQVAARVGCPVLVAYPARLPGGPVLVGVDGSPDSVAAVRFGLTEAERRDAELVAVHAERDAQTGEDALVAALAQVDEEGTQVKIHRRWIRGDPTEALVEESTTGQLIAVGARGVEGRARTLLGTASQALLRRAFCPVAIVHATRSGSAPLVADARPRHGTSVAGTP